MTPQRRLPYHLQTVGAVTLSGPAGPIRPTDPLALPLLCRVVFGDAGGVSDLDLQLCLTPELTPARARIALEQAQAALERAAGVPLLRRSGGLLLAARELLTTDTDTTGDGVPLSDRERLEFLPLVVDGAPEFTEWAASLRPSLRRAPAASRPVARRAMGRTTSGLILVAGLVLLAAVYATRAKPPPGFDSGDPIVLADFENRTGDTLFDRSLFVAAEIGLRQSPQLRLVERTRLVAALGRMGVTAGDTARVTADRAREIAVRENVRYYVVLGIDREGDGYLIGGAVRDASSGQAVGTRTAGAETRAGALAALDRVLQEVRADLGERRSERAARTVPLPEATTSSLEALRTYALGTGAWSRGDYRLARELWERSLDLDSGFTLAMASLGAYHYYHHNRDRGEQYFQQAVRRLGRLTEWERLRILDNHATYRGDLDSALVISRTIVDRYPNPANWYSLGTSLMQARREAEAVSALEEAVALDSTYVNAYLNLATLAKGRRVHEAIPYYHRARQFDSTTLFRPPISTEYGDALIRAGRFDEAEQHFRRLAAQPALYDRVLAYRGLGALALYRGQVERSLGHFRAAREAGLQDNSKLTIARNDLIEGLALLIAGDSVPGRAAIRRAADVADSSRFVPQFLMLLGSGLLRAGEIDRAEVLLSRIVASGDTVSDTDRESRRVLAGAVAVARRDWPQAVANLEKHPDMIRASGLRFAWLGQALTGAGDSARALIVLDSALAGGNTSNEYLMEWLTALQLQGDLASKMGRRDKATAVYQRLLDLWRPVGDTTAVLRRDIEQRLTMLKQ